jgi:hypothetical protein
LDAKVKHDIGNMKVGELRLIDDRVIAKITTRNGKTIIRGKIHRGKNSIPLFAPDETCGEQPFLLEHEEPPLTNTTDPDGNSDLVVEVHLYPKKQGYRFEEKLMLSKHTYCPPAHGPGCGWAVPPAHFDGTIAPKADGGWTAAVTYATFAF